MTHLLSIGDSITDCGRLFSSSSLGNGYVRLLSEHLNNTDCNISVENRGVDGFTVNRLLRNTADYLESSPDIITILIGINDIGLMMNTLRTTEQQHQMLEKFTADYQLLIQRLQTPFCSLLLLEPFIFPTPAMYKLWIPYLRNMSKHISALASGNRIPFIPLQEPLNNAVHRYGMSSITTDGIHLTEQGHMIIEEQLYPYVKALI